MIAVQLLDHLDLETTIDVLFVLAMIAALAAAVLSAFMARPRDP